MRGALPAANTYCLATFSVFEAAKKRQAEYEHYRLYPELPDWEMMGFYPMSKRRSANDNWYMLDFEARKKLMAGHARVGRKFAGRVSQLITGATRRFVAHQDVSPAARPGLLPRCVPSRDRRMA